jgi:hypothetical protein
MKATRTFAPLLALAALAAAPAAAHDTWFELRAPVRGELRLALGTGNQFPVKETGVDAKYLVSSGCRGAGGGRIALRRVGNEPAALLLGPMRGARAGEALSCWAQLEPFDIELQPALVEVYLKEVAAPPAVRGAWQAMRARGLPWRERYTKHARIELPGSGDTAQPLSMGMDIVLARAGSLRAGEPIEFQVLRDGAPLPDFAIELRGENSAFGIWRRTDAEGRVSVRAPGSGRFLLRGTELTPVDGARWESRFVTLAFEVAPVVRSERQ